MTIPCLNNAKMMMMSKATEKSASLSKSRNFLLQYYPTLSTLLVNIVHAFIHTNKQLIDDSLYDQSCIRGWLTQRLRFFVFVFKGSIIKIIQPINYHNF